MENCQEQEGMLREIVFNVDDFYDKGEMNRKIDFVMDKFADEMLQKNYIEEKPESDEDLIRMMNEGAPEKTETAQKWDFYMLGCTRFFHKLKEAINGDSFLHEGDVHRSSRFLKWKAAIKFHLNPMLDSLTKEFYKCYCMILDKKPIRVKYMEF